MRVNREEPRGDLKEGREPTVNPTLPKGTPSQVFKHVGDPRCVVVSAQAPPSRAALYPFDSYTNRYSQRLGGGPKHLSSTQPGGGLSLYELWLLKLTNLPVHCLMLHRFEIQSALELSIRDQWHVGRQKSSLILTGISATNMVLRE